MKPYKEGQNVKCRVKHAEKDGYAVTVIEDNSPGFIKTANKLEPGDEIIGVFVCVHNGRILLSQLFSAQRVTQEQRGIMIANWEKQLNDDTLDQAYEQQGYKRNSEKKPTNIKEGATSKKAKTDKKATSEKQVKNKKPAEKHMHGPAKKADGQFLRKRASDLFMQPVTLKDMRRLKTFKMSEHDLQTLITELEGGERTACIRVTCDTVRSRSAALLYKGRVIGSFHSSSKNPEAKPTEESLKAMLCDLDKGDSQVTIYDLPEDLVLPMSALFLGYPIESNPNRTARENFDYVMEWFAEHNSTVCVTIVSQDPVSTNLVLIHNGKLSGVFNVETQVLTRDDELDSALLEKYPHALVEASLHSPDWLDGKKPLGYSLAEANEKRLNR